MTAGLASVVVNNCNYAEFLRCAIDSALAQTYPNLEVVVVDDGSIDDSREIISSFGTRIVPVLKENGGQTSALNEGFRRCSGEVICFLDADDFLTRDAMERAVGAFGVADTVKVHWPLEIVDRAGKPTGRLKPSHTVPEGDLRWIIVRDGPDSALWPPTSGNAWSREFLARVLPIPEVERELRVGSASADAYLSMLAPLLGRVGRITEPLGAYRFHGGNDHSAMGFEERLERDMRLFRYRSEVLVRHCRAVGLEVDPEAWERSSWFFRIERMLASIERLIPEGQAFVLIDDNLLSTGRVVRGRQRIPFVERDGRYFGRPTDSAHAIRELERLRRSGATFVVVTWLAFWWLDHYREFESHLRARYPVTTGNDDIIVFDLRGERPA